MMRTTMIKDLIKLIRSIYGEDEIKLHPANITNGDISFAKEAMRNRVDCYGLHVREFESELASYTRSKHVIVTFSGTAALFSIFQCLDVLEHYTRFYAPNYSFRATISPFNYLAEDQVLRLVDTNDMLHLPQYNEYEYSKSCLFIPVHLFGQYCRSMHRSMVEDACQALGTFGDGRHAGTLGVAGALSFNGNKVITAGGGGAVLTNNDQLAESIREFIARGFNLRMPALNAALGLSQLMRIEEIISVKREIAHRYQEFFKDSEIDFLEEPSNTRSNYWLSTIILPSEEMREEWFSVLKENGIETRKGFEILNAEESTPTAKKMSARVLCLPSGVPN
jgi:perosamine synthetase